MRTDRSAWNKESARSHATAEAERELVATPRACVVESCARASCAVVTAFLCAFRVGQKAAIAAGLVRHVPPNNVGGG